MKRQAPISVSDLSSISFWIKTWEEVRRTSPLKASQEKHPQRWSQFYESVAHLWSPMGGRDRSSFIEIIETLLLLRVIRPGQSVLDLGCGPGDLALNLAAKGLEVTALDLSETMLAEVRKKARAFGLTGLKIVHSDWENFRAKKRFDLVLAAGFPQALEPAGISRVESFSRNHCGLILGSGEDPFPFRRLLWTRLVKTPFPDGRPSLICLFQFLLLTRKTSQIMTFPRQVILNQSLEQTLFFYRQYFALFGKKGPDTEDTIRDVLSPYVQQGKIRLKGQSGSILVWWKKPEENRYCMRKV